jgi:hypothetical protein
MKEKKSEVECPKCSKEFKHETIERFLEEEEKKYLLNYFKSLWNPVPTPKNGKFVVCCAYLFSYYLLFSYFLFFSSKYIQDR